MHIGMLERVSFCVLVIILCVNLCYGTGAQSHPQIFADKSELIWTKIVYPLNNVSSETVEVHSHRWVEVVVDGASNLTGFLILQAHAEKSVVLSYKRDDWKSFHVNGTNAGLVLSTNQQRRPTAFIHNSHNEVLSVLVIVRNYSEQAPVPGDNWPTAMPFLTVHQNLLITTVSVPTSKALLINNSLTYPRYDVYLTYMYEGDTSEEHFWQSVVLTSNLTELPLVAKKVDSFIADTNDTELIRTFVSYTGVGAVVTVAASYDGGPKSLYCTTVFYGCDFFDDEHHACTKLVTPFAGMFCASLLVFGPILLLLGHRWLNFTMFFSGTFTVWFFVFVTFVHVPHANIHVVGVASWAASLLGGIGWVCLWYKLRRPFLSAILIILMCGFLVAMITTHFLKYLLVPTKHNAALFIVIPTAFCLITVLYAIKDLKLVHIFACVLVGSYCTIVPPAFYFGSSLTYIVINCISVMSVEDFYEVIGYPPFQNSDIALLVTWVMLFIVGMNYQILKERTAPPFHPPNRQCWDAFKQFLSSIQLWIYSKCCLANVGSDADSMHEEESGLWRLSSACCRRSNGVTGYESFPSIGSESQSLSHRIVSRVQQAGSSE